ncbi:MAG: iron dependent repressor, metal binding and dimerization domain protein [Nitriliruptorales bacterium]|nr:iron dependent repressor, metal binding and dimerization domain protein [Nitriliruptorales bacterium]
MPTLHTSPHRTAGDPTHRDRPNVADGRDDAELRRHALAERLLSDVIGLEWSKVHREAERWEHVISGEVEERIVELLSDPGTCPHGNPIPFSKNQPDQSDAVALADAPLGLVEVIRIAEELEGDEAAMVQLEQCGFVPGRLAEVVGKRDGRVEIVGAVADAVLPPHVAAQTYVEPR